MLARHGGHATATCLLFTLGSEDRTSWQGQPNAVTFHGMCTIQTDATSITACMLGFDQPNVAIPDAGDGSDTFAIGTDDVHVRVNLLGIHRDFLAFRIVNSNGADAIDPKRRGNHKVPFPHSIGLRERKIAV